MEKPRSITPQERAKQYPGKFHADNNLLFCSTVMLLWITTQINCGAIPKGTQLQDHLLDVYELEKEKLKQKIKEAKLGNVAIMVDELGNDNGHCVIDIMATILDFDKLSPSGRNIADGLDTHFVTETNNKTVSQAVVKAYQ
ncbi:unnamed protein product [Porites evermanni]|uniref:Uncharacterized protein n=1 Tax=Porites evermanni TaxID=104178 RepID=A0ABN8RGB9_9CNID|nr:unnamed protein product [Porites evermanni]